MLIGGVEIDVAGLTVFNGLVNAHDHLEFALFPKLGRGPYSNATAWAKDIYHPDRSPVAEHLRVPKRLRMLWGGLRNLLAGVTTVCHHNAYDSLFDNGFPVRVVKRYGWAHSIEFEHDVRGQYDATPLDAPFLIHAGEGTDESARSEIFRLDALGVLRPNTVLIHAVGFDEEGWRLIRERGCSVVWCPRSNLFTLGATAHPPSEVPLALGTDSPLSAAGDLLDEICAAKRLLPTGVQSLVGGAAEKILSLAPRPDDFIVARTFGVPPDMVVIGGELRLISGAFSSQLTGARRSEFFPLEIEGRPPVLVKFDVPELIRQTRRHFEGPLKLAGREIAG